MYGKSEGLMNSSERGISSRSWAENVEDEVHVESDVERVLRLFFL